MTTAEKIDLKGQFLEECVSRLRHVVRHNGAAISAKADISEVADHATDMNPQRVKTMWMDINTIDRVKSIIRYNYLGLRLPDLTTEQLMEYSVNDERLTADGRSWAVVKITKAGTEILTYGGDYFQKYKKNVTTEEQIDPETGETSTVITSTTYSQEGDTERLVADLTDEDAAWMADVFTADITHQLSVYSEGGVDFYVIPCEIPGDLDLLVSIFIQRSAADGSGSFDPLEYGLTEKSCDISNEGMVGLPHGMWLIYDNSTLVSAPQALLIPKALADGTDTGIRFDRVKIVYNALVSGLDRLRLVGDSFGEEYIVSSQDLTKAMEGTWKE